ncbi:glycosyltransferase family 4 protein [Flavobacterium daejeonense]|uniref:glycosyltransferase family 4 protein n=1 Tax=Flavobacterium daejeonense TaxID=350893 RepID=UPI00047DE9AA|nr:glycosyltransferase family 4 protein [Flavobacterium daejeonense]
MTKVILISQVPLPYEKIGSWTTLYKNYLQQDHQIDFIVCEQPEYQFPDVNYSLVATDFLTKVQKKIAKNPYIGYFKALAKIIKPGEKYIIQIVDNFGIVKPLQDFLFSKKWREHCYLQFFYHGFPPFYGNFESRYFFETIDEMVLLTFDSYWVHKEQYTVLPTHFSVLHNGIDTQKFYKVSSIEKAVLKEKFGVKDKTVFIWCSQDRPKKGLHIILDAWKKVHVQNPNTVLWVIGCEPKKPAKAVEYLGRIPNEELAQYYQTADCYLFPTLWHEGFGLSLIEALHCGCYCIASALGGVPEVLQYGKLGKLIEKPHFVEEWEKAVTNFLEREIVIPDAPKDLYTAENWSNDMNKIIENAKSRLK